MCALATIPELAVRSRPLVSYHGHRRGRNFSEFSPVADEVRIAPARSPVLIALIDPKPLTRESLLKMLSTLPRFQTMSSWAARASRNFFS